MLKTSILNYHTSLKNSIKSNWAPVWIFIAVIVPLIAYVLLVFFESDLTKLLMSLFPPSARQGETFYIDFVFLAQAEVLWMGLFLLIVLIFFIYPSRESLDRGMTVRSRTKALYLMMLITATFFLITVWLADVTLEAFPNSSDEYAYIFQAELFSGGKWWTRAHDLPDFFYINNIPQYEGILVSRFPPGWPLILSAAFEIGMAPSLVNPILGLLTLVVFYFFAARYYNSSIAVWSVLILALSGFYIFNSASFFSHVSCALCALLFVFCIHRYREKENFVFGVLAGFFLGFVALIRYYTALLIFIPFLVYLLIEYRWRVVPLFVWMGIGGAPCLAYLCWYNYSITGNAFIPVTMWAYPDERIGFVKGHTVVKGLEHLVRRTLMFIYWTSPGLILMYIIFLWKKIRQPSTRFLHPESYAFLALTIGHFFYYQIGGNQYGPRFMFEALPFLVLFVVGNVFESRAKWAFALLVACSIYPVVKFPFISHRESRIVDQRQDLYDLVADQKISNAVVIVSSPTSSLRPMPPDDLTRNTPGFMDDVIYVVSLPGINQQIMEYYPERAFYKYVRDVDSLRGELVRIR